MAVKSAITNIITMVKSGFWGNRLSGPLIYDILYSICSKK